MNDLVEITLDVLKGNTAEFTTLKVFNGYLGLYGPGPVSWYLAVTAYAGPPKPRYELYDHNKHPEFLASINAACQQRSLKLYVKYTKCLEEHKL